MAANAFAWKYSSNNVVYEYKVLGREGKDLRTPLPMHGSFHGILIPTIDKTESTTRNGKSDYFIALRRPGLSPACFYKNLSEERSDVRIQRKR